MSIFSSIKNAIFGRKAEAATRPPLLPPVPLLSLPHLHWRLPMLMLPLTSLHWQRVKTLTGARRSLI